MLFSFANCIEQLLQSDTFYRGQNGGFSPQAYKSRDDVPANLKRAWSLIEEAYACIAQKLRKK